MTDPVPDTDYTDYYDEVRREIEPLLPADASRVLEIGCGAGGTMRWLRSVRDVSHAAGVELVPEVAVRARDIFDEIEVGSVEASGFAFQHKSFDLILALDVLEHLVDPWSVAARLRSKLAEGGTFIASIPNISYWSAALPLLTRGSWNYQDSGILDRTHLRFFTRETAIELFERTGYEVLQVLPNAVFPDLLMPKRWSSRRSRWYSEKLLRRFPLVPERFLTLQYLLAARPAGEASSPGG
jgi:predicted TPR repeat methyltransferase